MHFAVLSGHSCGLLTAGLRYKRPHIYTEILLWGVDVGALPAGITSLKGHPRDHHPYRRLLGWHLRQGYHTDCPT